MQTAALIFEEVKALPERDAQEILDFVAFLKTRRQREQDAQRDGALAVLDKYQGIYDGTPFNREELYDRPNLR